MNAVLLAAAQMSHSAQFVIYLIAFILLVIAAILAWVPSKLVWATFVSSALALCVLVLMWNQLALS